MCTLSIRALTPYSCWILTEGVKACIRVSDLQGDMLISDNQIFSCERADNIPTCGNGRLHWCHVYGIFWYERMLDNREFWIILII